MNTQLLKERVRRFASLREMIQPVPDYWFREAEERKRRESEIQLEECTNYQDLVAVWRRAMQWTDEMDMALSIILAVTMTTLMKEDQVWLRLISIASSGKTTLCEAISACRQYVVPKDTITRFYSGYKTPDGEDTSIIAQVNGKTLVTKDGDTILQASDRALLLAQARSLFDTSGRTHYNNQTSRDYENVRFTWILAGTHRLKDLDESELGERFIDFVLMDKVNRQLSRTIGERASIGIWADRGVEVNGKAETLVTRDMKKARAMTAGYVKYLRENASTLRMRVLGGHDTPESIRVRRYGEFVSYLRCKPPTDRKKVEQEVRSELPTRLGKQLEKLSICLAATMGESSLSPEVMRRIKKVAMDTAKGKPKDILDYVILSKDQGSTETQIKLACGLSNDRVETLLRHMEYNGILERYKDGGQIRYRVKKEFKQLYREVHAR